MTASINYDYIRPDELKLLNSLHYHSKSGHLFRKCTLKKWPLFISGHLNGRNVCGPTFMDISSRPEVPKLFRLAAPFCNFCSWCLRKTYDLFFFLGKNNTCKSIFDNRHNGNRIDRYRFKNYRNLFCTKLQSAERRTVWEPLI